MARSAFRAAGRSAFLALVVLVGVVAVRVLTAVPGYGRTRRGTSALQGFSRIALYALGIRVVSNGAPRSGPSLVVANHVCWLDILVLGAAGPMVPVVAADVRQCSMIGPTVARVGALFVRRACPRELSGTVQRATATLRGGHRVLVFPENWQANDSAREPFSRAVFQAAVDAAVVISPVALSYPRSTVASTEFDDLRGSLWRILRAGPLTVRVNWLPVIPAVAGPGHPAGHRNAAARRTEWAIARALGQPVMTRRVPVAAHLPVAAQLPVAGLRPLVSVPRLAPAPNAPSVAKVA
jgi:1-acyl-sn-glycerol-3-phosphate acyltransferase